jgi:hypothetical protein
MLFLEIKMKQNKMKQDHWFSSHCRWKIDRFKLTPKFEF